MNSLRRLLALSLALVFMGCSLGTSDEQTKRIRTHIHQLSHADAAARSLGAIGSEVNDRLFWVLMNTPESNQTQRRVAKLLGTRKDGRIFEPLTKPRLARHTYFNWKVR